MCKKITLFLTLSFLIALFIVPQNVLARIYLFDRKIEITGKLEQKTILKYHMKEWEKGKGRHAYKAGGGRIKNPTVFKTHFHIDALWHIYKTDETTLDFYTLWEWFYDFAPDMRGDYGRGIHARDRNRYQTIYAKREGSVASPTAGLHFNDEILRMMRSRGVTLLPLTLHVGPGTFRPLADETVENNKLPPEYVMIKNENWREIAEARGLGRRVIAVGTTTTRALEAMAADRLMEQERLELEDGTYTAGWTDLFIYPGFGFRVIDSLLTNLHLPRSSLLLLVAAFAGREKILETYRWAVERRFRFYSYGDVMFIR